MHGMFCSHTDGSVVTTHNKHALEIARDLPLDKYDAVATMSGDGLVHEVINGFAQHTDAIRALRTPVAPIPTGSANGLCLNILGMQVRGDATASATIACGPPTSQSVWANALRRRASTSPPPP